MEDDLSTFDMMWNVLYRKPPFDPDLERPVLALKSKCVLGDDKVRVSRVSLEGSLADVNFGVDAYALREPTDEHDDEIASLLAYGRAFRDLGHLMLKEARERVALIDKAKAAAQQEEVQAVVREVEAAAEEAMTPSRHLPEGVSGTAVTFAPAVKGPDGVTNPSYDPSAWMDALSPKQQKRIRKYLDRVKKAENRHKEKV
jgi:hypothetical protein